MTNSRRLISFDWAMKKLLRSKANFDILEGFLSELLNDNLSILEILESESNQETENDKYNRVDLKVKTQTDEIIIIEVQYDREYDYLHRLAYGSAKVITEHLEQGAPYSDVVRVISVNIVYFNLGEGDDYVYHGTTQFSGIHNHNPLQLSPVQKELYKKTHVHEIYPEYYLIKVDNFDDIARNSLDEWVYFLKNEEIKDNFKAKGLKKAKVELDVMRLTEDDRQAYEKHQDDLHHQASMVKSNYDAGTLNGLKKGIEQGIEQGAMKQNQENAKAMKKAGVTSSIIADVTGLSITDINLLSKS
ncbi:MAG: hypothetical protein COB35_06825 [Gammaproteobacteria bacterium]|nr:MAG: hypothetical protein COB35_06825 [Gammaproteobacteria bacterium]